MNVYVDLDGVLADFDGFFAAIYNKNPKDWEAEFGEEDFWEKVNGIENFFYRLPKTNDADELMDFLKPHDPIILTAASRHCPDSCVDKIDWVKEMFGPQQRVITVLGGKNKHWYCRRGDILIDDWESYAPLWRAKGGIWITHKNTKQTIEELSTILRDSLDI